jgi:hypothetical protein
LLPEGAERLHFYLNLKGLKVPIDDCSLIIDVSTENRMG